MGVDTPVSFVNEIEVFAVTETDVCPEKEELEPVDEYEDVNPLLNVRSLGEEKTKP
jgi:hypothetical protein